MKRLISWVLTVMMVVGLFGGFCLPAAMAATATDTSEYDALVTAGSSEYGKTMIVNSAWTNDDLSAGKTLTYVFRGKTYTETYDANRHFNTFGSAQDAWFARYTSGGELTKEVAKNVPNYILLGEILRTDPDGNPMGTNEQKNTCLSDMWIRFSANLYGATAGIDPNDPDYDPETALPGSDWALNDEWVNPTVLKTTIFQSTRVDRNQHTTDTRFEKLYTAAGVNDFTLKIDGLQFDATDYNDVPVWQYGVTGYKRNFNLVVKNTFVNGGEFFVACNEDASRNLYSFDFDNLRIDGISQPMFVARPNSIDANRVNFINGKHANSVVYDGGNIVYAAADEKDRGIDWKFANSRFADNRAQYMWRCSDNIYLNWARYNFDGCLFDNALVADGRESSAAFAFKNFGGNARYPRFSYTFTDNTFRFSKGTVGTLLFGYTWATQPYDVTATGNRFIGFAVDAFPAIGADYPDIATGSNFVYERNYYADTFVSENDLLGEKPEYKSNETDQPDPIDTETTSYYLDYKKTTSPTDLLLTGASFENKVHRFKIDHKANTVTAVIREERGLDNIRFTPTGTGVTVKVYSDAEMQNEITSIAAADIEKTYYIHCEKNGSVRDYTLKLTVATVKGFANWTDATGTMDMAKVGVVLPTGNYVNGQNVEIIWQDGYYDVTVGTDAFDSPEDAISAGKTEIILPVGTYDNIRMHRVARFFGNRYNVAVNVKGKDVTDDWTMAKEWETDCTVVKNIEIPVAVDGGDLYFNGIVLTEYFKDTSRQLSYQVTNIVLDNCLISSNKRFAINLQNANSNNTDASIENKDSFTLINSRFNAPYDSGSRIFSEITPAYFTVENSYFADFYILNWPKTRECVKNGVVTLKDNYFKDSKNYVMGITGAGQYFSAANYNNKAVVSGNVFYDACSDGAANIDIYPAAFASVEVVDNYFIDTVGKSVPFSISTTSSKTDFSFEDFSDKIVFKRNRLIGTMPWVRALGATTTLTYAGDNYYADYRTPDVAIAPYGVLEGSSYYLDYAMTVKASDMDIVANGDFVGYNNDVVSVISKAGEDYIPAITATDKNIVYKVYGDEMLTSELSAINKAGLYYASATKNGVTKTYKLYVSFGNASATEYADAYLLDTATATMPAGTVYVKTFKGTEYKFTAGVNAFASVAQITSTVGADNKVNVLLPEGTYDNIKVTGDVNFIGDNAVVKATEFDTTSPIKIAAVGDSITEANAFGEPGRYTYGYPTRLEEQLDDIYGDGKYVVENFGKGNSTAVAVHNSTDTTLVGATRSQYMQGSWYYCAQDYNPDVVIIMIGHNDTDTALFQSKEVYKAYYQQMIDTFRALPSHPQVIISGNHDRAASFRRNILTDVIIPAQQELAAENNLIYIDNFSKTVNIGSNSHLSSDGLHFTAEGYKFLARLIREGMAQVFTDTRNATSEGVTFNADAVISKDEKVKVALIGDDITYGSASLKNYPDYLRELMGDGYEVRNYGEPKAKADNWKTVGGYAKVGDYTSSIAWKPDIAVFMLGNNDTADMTAAYTELINEYKALGTTVYVANSIRTNSKAATVNPYIKNAATATGATLIDTYALTKDFGDEMYNNTYLTQKGNEALAGIIYDSLNAVTPDFADVYEDSYNQIAKDAVVVDYELTASLATGNELTYDWDGKTFKFYYGINVFKSIDDALASNAAKDGTVQILIPANNIGTSFGKINISDTANAGKMTSIEIYGVNRNIDPNDKSAVAKDPTADWSLNKEWGKYGESGLDEIWVMTTGANTLKGTLSFNGITMREIFVDQSRTAHQATDGGEDYDTRNLTVKFENTVYNPTAAQGYAKIFWLNNKYRVNQTTADTADKIIIRNFHVAENRYNNVRFFETQNYPFVEIDGLYINGAKNVKQFAQLGWLQNNSGPDNAHVIVKNSNLRNTNATLFVPKISATTRTDATKTSTVEFLDNVYFTCSAAESSGAKGYIVLFPEWTDTMRVEGNIFVTETGENPIDFVEASGWTNLEYNYAPNYSIKNNTFIMSDKDMLKAALESAVPSAATTNLDITGIYVGIIGGTPVDITTLGLADGKFTYEYYYDSLAKVHKIAGPEFDKTYVDAQNQIKADAFLFDADMSANYANGDAIPYTWDGKTYSFTVGVNAFKNTTDLIAAAVAADKTEIQVIIPANNGSSDKGAYDFVIPDNANSHAITKIEVFGVNRNIDPNDKSASKDDPLADWTLNKEWGKNGESSVTRIQIATETAANIFAGELSFNGITIRNPLWDNRPAVANSDLDVSFENVVVNYTKTSTWNGYLFNFSGSRYKSTTVANDDTLTVKNFRVEKFTPKSGNTRIFSTGCMNYVTFDNFYLSSAKSPNVQMGYLQSGNSVSGVFTSVYTAAAVTFKNSNVRGVPFDVLPDLLGQNARAEGRPLTLTFTDNVFYNNTSYSIRIFGEWTSKVTIENNYFVNTNGKSPVAFVGNDSNKWTLSTVDYAKAIDYNLKNNTFILNKMSNLDAARPNTVTTVDLTGNFVTTDYNNYKTAFGTGITNEGFKADYYYLDFAKTIRSDIDVAISGVTLEGATDVVFDNETKKITAVAPATTVIANPAVTCVDTTVKGVFTDKNGKLIDKIDMANGKFEGKVVLSINGTTVATYDVTVTDAPVVVGDFADFDDTDSVVKNTAVAFYPAVAGKSAGDKVQISWNGTTYNFTVGVNVFALMASIPSNKTQVIVPAGKHGDITIGRSIEIYGEGYANVPYVFDGDYAYENPEFVATGNSVVENVIVSASATPTNVNGTTILVSGLRITKGIVDKERYASNYKTDITLKNNILDRCIYAGEEREFDLRNANNTNATNSHKNIDSFTVKDMFFINRTAHTKHALFQEAMPAYLTFDGFVCNQSMASFGFPKWRRSVTEGEMVFRNCFVKDHKDASSRFETLVYFTGHQVDDYTTNERKDLDLTLVVENNRFINCGYEPSGHDPVADIATIQIYPAAFSEIKVNGNDFVSEMDYNYLPITYQGYAGGSDNVGNMTDKFEMKNNRFIGTLAPWKVNADTTLDMSENYFETYNVEYKTGVTGDIPADTDADYYLDYAMTTKLSDIVPASSTLAGFKVNSEVRFIYGYAEAGAVAPTFTKDGVTYTVSAMSDVVVGGVSKGTVTAQKDGIKFTFDLYVIGVKDVDDVAAANTAVDGVSDATLYFPALHGAPNGIEVVAYYDGKAYKFTTGKNVATTEAMLGFYTDNIVVPDSIEEISLTVMTEVNIYAKGTLKSLATRKVKIGAVGDSITAGGWPEAMQKYLGTANYEVKNFGQSGATVTETYYLNGGAERKYTLYAKAKYDASIAYNPDFIIIGLGTNDAYGNRWEANDRYIDQYIELIRTYQNLPSKPAVYLTPMTEAYDNGARTRRRDNNIVYMQYLVAKMTGAKILDARTLLDFIFEPTANEYCTDLLHPTTPLGYNVMGETLGQEIQKTYTAATNISFNGGKIDGTVAASLAGTTLTINNALINTTTAPVNGANVTKLNLKDNIYTKDGQTLSKITASDIVTGGTLYDAANTNAVESIDLLATETAVSYTIRSTANIGTTVQTQSANATLAALQVTVKDTVKTEAHCDGLWAAFDAARKVDAYAISAEAALEAIADIKALGGHVFGNKASQSIKSPADCDNAATYYVQCDNCDAVSDTKTVSVGTKNDHVFTNKDSGVKKSDAYCQSAQLNYVQCDNCTVVSDTVTVAVGEIGDHRHTTKDSGQMESEATCQSKQTNYVQCDFCDNVHSTMTVEVGEFADHKYENYVSDNNATCQSNCTETSKCNWCDKTDTRDIEDTKVDHKFENYVSDNNATCKSNCTETAKCKWCDETDTRDIADTKVTHKFENYKSDNNATCKSNCTETSKCNWCDETDTRDIADSKADHKFENYVSDKNATCCEDGTKTAKCKWCDLTDTITDKGTATGHKETEKIFKDVVKDKWYNDAIDYAYTHGFISGMSATEFGVSTPVTRGMFITILARIAGVDTTKNNVSTKFTDVANGKYYTAAIKWASENGIVNGMSETTFEPNSAIQRQQLCVMIVNFAKFMKIDLEKAEDEIAFSDASTIAKWAKDAVKTCQMADIVNGYANGNKFEFRPKNTATRAEAAQILYKFHSEFIAK